MGSRRNLRLRVNVLSWQWDETAQKLRGGLAEEALKGERLGQAPVSRQVMMQHGLVGSYVLSDDSCIFRSEPLFSRSLLLESQTTMTLLKGIQQAAPPCL